MENKILKLRAWDVKNKKMFSPFDGELSDFFLDIEFRSRHYKSKFVLMQWTGLKDKHGTDIYQGDLLRVIADEYGYGETSYEGIVKVTSEICGFRLEPISPTLEERSDSGKFWDNSSLWHLCETHSVTGEGTTEIIGNIFENME